MDKTFKKLLNDPLKEYECQKETIEELLADIEAGLLRQQHT